MSNNYFSFKKFTIWQDRSAMKVTTDACLFGAWASHRIQKIYSSNFISTGRAIRVADVGAGTGLLSLMLHQKNPSLEVEGIEIDPHAAEQAKDNISKAGATTHIKIHCGDATDFIASAAYDIIISNPPFYRDDLKATRQKRNWAFHDETLSLPQLFAFIMKNLSENGNFFLLLPSRREQELKTLMDNYALQLFEKIAVKSTPDSPVHRILVAGKKIEGTLQPSNRPQLKELFTEEIDIASPSGEYSARFRELLSEYYLSL
jgi:tRNA1Val (adenine37-N6)-methyltransferase